MGRLQPACTIHRWAKSWNGHNHKESCWICSATACLYILCSSNCNAFASCFAHLRATVVFHVAGVASNGHSGHSDPASQCQGNNLCADETSRSYISTRATWMAQLATVHECHSGGSKHQHQSSGVWLSSKPPSASERRHMFTDRSSRTLGRCLAAGGSADLHSYVLHLCTASRSQRGRSGYGLQPVGSHNTTEACLNRISGSGIAARNVNFSEIVCTRPNDSSIHSSYNMAVCHV